MTQSRHRRPSSRVTHALVFVSALLLAPSVLSGAASAQVLGYASTQPNAFPADEVMGEPEGVVPERLRRAVVAFNSTEAPGTIVIDTGNTALYYVLGQGRAIRYGVGVGREGFTWSGVQTISRKAEWPDQRSLDHRQVRLERMHPPDQRGRQRPLQPRRCRHQGRGAAEERAAYRDPHDHRRSPRCSAGAAAGDYAARGPAGDEFDGVAAQLSRGGRIRRRRWT
jgi:hypothetical protein